jgi:hypothetical protein
MPSHIARYFRFCSLPLTFFCQVAVDATCGQDQTSESFRDREDFR